MKYLKKKYLIILLIVFLFIPVIFIAYLNGFFTPYAEKLINETPKAKITAYIQAISAGDKEKALNIWELSENQDSNSGNFNELRERREKITNELIERKMSSDFTVVNVELWRTCCIPGVINNYIEAGGSRVNIKLMDKNGVEYNYIFDVFNKNTSYGGSAEGYPIRHWIIRDIYSLNQEPIFWKEK